MRLLVVDDEAGLRVTLAANLELEGFEVTEAESVAQALELLRTQRFDMLVSDVRMPGRDGVSGLDDIRKLQPDLPVVFITGYDADGVLPHAIAKGAYTVLPKPVSIEHLVDVVKRGATAPAVLVVDDEAPFLETMVAQLRDAGLRVETALDGDGAVRSIIQKKVDVCVLDLVLPREDGATLFERLRDIHPDVQVIAMTSHDVSDLIKDVMSSGAYRCLRKPFEIQVLVRLIGRARSERPAADVRRPTAQG